ARFSSPHWTNSCSSTIPREGIATMAITDYVRSNISPADGYTPVPSRLSDRPVIRLDWNESPYPLTPKAREVLATYERGNRYPDYQQTPLREALGQYVGFDPKQIVPGAGLDD